MEGEEVGEFPRKLIEEGVIKSIDDYITLRKETTTISFRIPVLHAKLYKERLGALERRLVKDTLIAAIEALVTGKPSKVKGYEDAHVINITYNINVYTSGAREQENEQASKDEEAEARVEQLRTMVSVWERLNTLDPRARKALREALESPGSPHEKLERAAKVAQELYKQGLIPKAVATNIVKKAVEAQKQG